MLFYFSNIISNNHNGRIIIESRIDILITLFAIYVIVQTIIFGNPQDLIEFTRGIQEGSAIDSNAVVEPSDMPGYTDKVIMASGSFTQGSSIELSCDGPRRKPSIAYMQGSLTYPYGKLGLMKAVQKIMKGGN